MRKKIPMKSLETEMEKAIEIAQIQKMPKNISTNKFATKQRKSQPYRTEFLLRNVFYPPPFTCNKTPLECPKGVKDDVKQARRAKRVAEGHQVEIGAQRAPRFLVTNKTMKNL